MKCARKYCSGEALVYLFSTLQGSLKISLNKISPRINLLVVIRISEEESTEMRLTLNRALSLSYRNLTSCTLLVDLRSRNLQ